MKKQDVQIGEVYIVKVSGKLTRVRLDSESPYGGWTGTNLETKREVRIRTAAKLRRPASTDTAKTSPQPEPISPSTPDFFVENHGSIVLLRPVTPAANEWVEQHIPDDAQYFGNAVVVEPRYIEGIVNGIQNDGLEVR